MWPVLPRPQPCPCPEHLLLFFNFYLLFLVALGLHCRVCVRGEQGLLSATAPGFLILVASLVAEHGF